MRKIVLLVSILLLLTGCQTKYHLIINDNLTITEEAELGGTNEFFETYYKSTKKNVLKTQIDSYKDILDENSYKYELIEEENPYVKVQKKYENISNYIENTLLLNDYFDEIKYTEDGNIKKIETIGYNENNGEDPNRFDIKELEISIRCPFKVKNHNAKKVDKKTNTYYYDLFKDKKIIFEYDISKKFNPNEDIYITLAIGLIVIAGSWLTVFVINKKNKK